MRSPNELFKRTLVGLGCSLLVLCLPAAAQDAKVSKEREALRRAQTALRAATEQQDGLQAEKAKLAADKDRLEKELLAARSQSQGEAARLKQVDLRSEAFQGELQAAVKARQVLEAGSQQREQELQQQVQAARRESAERLQSARALTALLEQSTQALAGAEAKNRQLYAIGQDLVKRYLSRGRFEDATIGDPLLGLTDVKLENQAEELRSKLAAQKLP